MKYLQKSETIAVPDKVTVTIDSRVVSVKGPRTTLKKDFGHVQADIALIAGGKKIRVDMWFGSHREMAVVSTIKATLNNMFKGVLNGFRYKMRCVAAHFPINPNITDGGKVLEIRNFLGEKIVRRVEMTGDVKVQRSAALKDELILEGSDIQEVSQSAASIWTSCRIHGKDIRKFLDGIYVSERSVM